LLLFLSLPLLAPTHLSHSNLFNFQTLFCLFSHKVLIFALQELGLEWWRRRRGRQRRRRFEGTRGGAIPTPNHINYF